MVASKDIQQFIQTCQHLRVLVIGDLMLDRYLWGRVDRISPEAPVPVVDVYQEENRLGGAANVAMNLYALGARPVLCGLVGNDPEGQEFLNLAAGYDFSTDLIKVLPQRRTTVKIRVIGNQQQVLRIDKEDRQDLEEAAKEGLIEAILPRIKSFDAIIIQDYDKGLLSERLAHSVINGANRQGIPVMIDPKFKNFFSYRGCFLFKPNLKEFNEGLGERFSKSDLTTLIRAVGQLRETMPHANTLVTLSENGMLVVDEKGAGHHIPARVRNVRDVSGAGDTVISVVALGIAAGLSPLKAAHLANIAGGLVCEEVGVVPVRKEALLTENG